MRLLLAGTLVQFIGNHQLLSYVRAPDVSGEKRASLSRKMLLKQKGIILYTPNYTCI